MWLNLVKVENFDDFRLEKWRKCANFAWKKGEIMLKRKIDRYIRDFYAASRNALLVTGARQIGKTFSIRQFGAEFESFVEINFVEQPEASRIFSGANGAKEILLRLSAIADKPLVPGHTLVFFDEVQKCPEAVTAIKFLVEEGSYRYVLSGSLLGVELKDLRSVPVGYMGVTEMYPLDLEEFVENLGVSGAVMNSLRSAWEKHVPVDEVVHSKMLELFRLYLVVGGMPAAVSEYLSSNNLQRVMAVQQDIIRLYKRDIAQYDPNAKLNIEEIFDLIPSELDAKNRRFILKSLNENAKFQTYRNSFLWLTNAGVAIPVFNVSEPKVPLTLSRLRNLFKLFQNDVGLLAAQYAEGIQLGIIAGHRAINIGAVYENAVAQELLAHNIAPYYYNNKHRGEVDFVVQIAGKVVPIEVKSGKDYDVHRALANILDCDEFNIEQAIVLSNENLRVSGKIVYAPIYMAMFILRNDSAPMNYKIDLSGLV